MHQEAIPSPSVAEEDAMAEQVIMRLLLEDRGLLSLAEVAKELSGNTLAAADAIARLQRGGLIHELGGFVFASRSAVVSADLWGAG